MTKRKHKTKRLVAAAITVFTLLSVFTVANAATEGSVVRFFMGGREIEGDYGDHVDREGFRHITFNAVIPIDADNFAVIYDVDKPWGENVRVITEEADPEFVERLRLYHKGICDETYVKPEDFGLVFKDSEICSYRFESGTDRLGGFLGGNFLNAVKPPDGKVTKVGSGGEIEYDTENATKTFKETICYYVGKE